jgi:hypothetical protein
MFRYLALVVLCSLTLPAVAATGGAERNVFLAHKDGKAASCFARVEGKAWVELGFASGRNEFREVEHNKEFILLYDKSREVEVRIYADQYMWRFLPKGQWEGKIKGRWVE